MLGSDVLDIGIGVTLLFLVTSLICSAMNELIEAILKARAAHIETGLRELLSDDDGAFLAQLYHHPLIAGLYRGDYDPRRIRNGRWRGWGPRDLPTYIPAASFARALIDVVVRGDPDQPAAAGPITLDGLRTGIKKLQNARLQRALMAALDEGQADLQRVQASLETWFNTGMDRVSGWYKRRTAVILFWLGLGIAVGLNVDAITIAQRLSSDRTLRERFVAEASQAAPNPAADARVADLRRELDGMGAPIGWRGACPAPQEDLGLCRPLALAGGFALPEPSGPLAAVRIAAGWLMTAFAVTFGAPFWFDVLNRFMVVRSTVKPAQKSGQAAPAEPQAAPAALAPAAGPPSASVAPRPPAPAAQPPLPAEEDLDAPATPAAPIPDQPADRAAAEAEELH